MRGIVVFSGSSHPALGDRMCKRLGCETGKASLDKFSNNETRVEIYESVRERDVYIVQSGCGHVNDNLMELLIMIQACKTASAKKVTAVIPFFPYSRQPDVPYRHSGAPLMRAPPLTVPSTPRTTPSSPKLETFMPLLPLHEHDLIRLARDFDALDDGHEIPIFQGSCSFDDDTTAYNHAESFQYRQWVARSGTLVAELLTCAGADHVITMDLHDPQFQGFFDCPVDNLSSLPLMMNCIQRSIPNYAEAVIVSPDAGGAKRASLIAEKLHMDFALIHKERRRLDKRQKHDLMLVGDVKDRPCVLIDDIADTGFTITKAAKSLHEKGATSIYAIITHAIFSGDAVERIDQSFLDRVFVSDSVHQNSHVQKCKKISAFSVAPLFAEAIRRTHNGESLSTLFDVKY